MDADSNDGTASEVLNGDTKPDPAKLAQSAIIKQDVMLSATSTQSPLATVSSVFSMPPVSMSNSTSMGGLHDNLFMSVSAVADHSSGHSLSDHKSEPTTNGSISSSLTGQPQQLFGQPQVATPQFFIASPPSLGATTGAANLPVQQLLIPVSTGNGTQQFISIPVSLATGGNQQIQLLTTSNGQLLATNLSSIQGLATPINMSIPNTGSSTTPNQTSSTAHNSTSSAHHSIATGVTANQIAALPQLLTGATQNQILAAVGQQVLAPVTVASVAGSAGAASVGQAHSSSVQSSHASSQSPSVNHSNSTSPSLHQQLAQAVHSTVSNAATTLVSPASLTATVRPANSHPVTVVSTAEGLSGGVGQLLPNTVSNSTESTTVDGINLDEIKEFAKQFKIRRLSLGLTQTQVGQALSATEGPAYSQSAICRFEKLDITPKSAQKIKPVLERWMREAEERYKNGVQNLTEFIGSEPSKKRKRRTSFTPQALEHLNQHFERNTHPSGAEMTELADKLNYDREVIRVWFCNKRQALKNTIKKLKQPDQP
ncbi:POU domain, class 6, transcription factor 1-like [Liolophura sinensis]|uniref:POU domain, class 6, transcription factor 1-like n=1 Tax=Liolophura sinensis TaxID=3198878 RepID=UPI0031592CB2